MRLHDLPVQRRRRKKRLGRGNASGHGTYSGHGIKGQHARAGARIRPGFEGGQTRIFQRLPKRRGFRSLSERTFAVNVGRLERVFPSGAHVDLRALLAAGLVSADVRLAKILGDGALTKSLTVALPVSAKAREKIEHAGGTVETVPVRGNKGLG